MVIAKFPERLERVIGSEEAALASGPGNFESGWK